MTQVAGLTPDNIVDRYNKITGDTTDTDLAYDLLNEVKDELEGDDAWAILRTLDESQTANAGDTYLTTHALPTDFAEPNPGGIFVGSDQMPYVEVNFEDRIKYQSSTHRYYIDYANGLYALCGTVGTGGTIHFHYRKSSPVLAAGGAAWIFPARFHKILYYLMAIKYFAIDQGNKAYAWDDRWEIHAEKILSTMRRWNARLLKQGNANSNLRLDQTANPLVVDIDGGGNGSIYGG